MANATPLVTTVMKPTNDPGEANTTSRVNIHELCEEYYEYILLIIMEKACHEQLKDVHARLDFGEGPQERTRENSHYSNTKAKNTDPERVKIQYRLKYGDRPADAQVERWAMPTWCHMFNSTLIGAARKKYVKDPVEIRNIKQRDGETLEDFMKGFKIETGRMKGAPECMRISRFMHGINNPKLTKRLNEHVPRTMEEMMIATAAFIRGEAAATNKKKGHLTPKEILAAEANKFQPPPPMVTPVQKRNGNKFCDFYNDKGHSTDECMQLKKQIKELVRAGKLSHLINEIKQGQEQPKTGRKEATAKDKPTMIYMVRSWKRTVKQKITQSFEQGKEITFAPLANRHGTKGPLVKEAEVSGHTIHRMYIDGGSSMEILYEHCFNRLRPDIQRQMVPTTMSLTGFSGETTWPLGQLKLLVTIGNATHSTKAWMNFMIVKSLSPYNGIIRRPGLKAIQAIPSTVHGMLKFPTEEGIVTICSSLLIPVECASVDTSSVTPREKKARPTNLTLPLHPNFPDQEVVVGGSLSDKGRTELCSLFKKNLDIFAWQPFDMTGVPRSVAEHRLNVREGCPPMRQKKRGQAPESTKAIQAEVKKLVEAGIMREVFYHDWLSNPVMRLMDKAFENQMGRNIEVYVDDLVVKSHTEMEMDQAMSRQNDSSTTDAITTNNQRDTQKIIKKTDFRWTTEAEQAFQQLKQHLSALPLLAAPKPQEELNMYLSATHGAISAVLLTERGTAQTPVYFISRALQGPELNYSPMEKLVLSLVFEAKRLRIYFQAHPIAVITDQPIKQVMSHPDAAGRLQKWSIMLGEHNTTYIPRTSIKGQILADFLNEMPRNTSQVIEEEGPTWMTELMNYLKEGTLPEDEKEARKIRLKARQPLFVRVGESQVPDRHNGLLHEVDRSKSGGNDYRWTSEEIRMGQYCMPLRNDASHTVAGGKLGPKWEGPYEVTDALGNRAYKLRSTDGTVLPRT
nr:reverse transcriptase domain-containing protein [Tanacetum cinerariifolium]